MGKYSRSKGSRGERMFRDLCRDAGYSSALRTGWHQSRFGGDAPDVTIPELPFIWAEVKFVEKLNVRAAFAQAEAAAALSGQTPTVFHKTSNAPWLVTLSAEDFLRLCGRTDLVTSLIDETTNTQTP